MPRMQIPEKLLPLVERPKRFCILLGGRGSAKSVTIADLFLMKAQTQCAKIGCFREFMNSIDDSVHALVASEVERLGLVGFSVLKNAIRHDNGAEFKFKGLARNPEGIKSAHDFDYFFVEEAQTISFDSLKALTPTLRKEGSQIWMAANPRSSADPFSQRFIKPFERDLRRDGIYEDDLHLIIWINYNDNPLFPDVLEQERQHDEATLSKALYRHIWLGEFYDEIDDTIIPVDWFDSAIDAHLKLGFKAEGPVVAAHDPSDEGEDAKGYASRKGSVVLSVEQKSTGDAADGVDWALGLARSEGADLFIWDCDGLGVSLKRQVSGELDGTQTKWQMFKGSESPENPDAMYVKNEHDHKGKRNRDTFANKRAQFYWSLRERFFATHRAVTKGEYINPDEMISLPSGLKNIDALRSEVCRIPQKRNNNGKIQIMSKIDMAKKPYQLPSPNMADALMMCMVSAKENAKPVEIDFAGWG